MPQEYVKMTILSGRVFKINVSDLMNLKVFQINLRRYKQIRWILTDLIQNRFNIR